MLFRFALGLNATNCRALSSRARSGLSHFWAALLCFSINKAVTQAAYAGAWLCNLVPAICDEISDY
jgi:hypothetical protein